MPYINVKIAGNLSIDQKKDIAEKFSEVLKEVAGKDPKSTYIVFEEVSRADWAVGGKLLNDQ